MSGYWAQEDWPTQTAYVHASECRFCNNGQGVQPTRTGKNNA